VRTVQRGPIIGLLALFVLLGALDTTVGLDARGWVVGIVCGTVTSAVLGRGLTSHRLTAMGPADRVTLARCTLACGVAALVADSFHRSAPVAMLVAITVVALVLDRVDGWVARRTATVSRLGARFDMEVDAFLILLLSVYVARSAGLWVLAIGLSRYAFVAAGSALPWLRGDAPPRPWCKVVAAMQGVVLAVATAGILPQPATDAGLVVALVLLAESFGRESWWLWAHRKPGGDAVLLSARAPDDAEQMREVA
jgi:phosphatidylglycerophosphate synthase